jgi:cytochrome c553
MLLLITRNRNKGQIMKKNLALAVVLASSAVSFNAFAGGNVDAGKAAAEKYNCAACHGKDYNNPIDPSYPKLAGQHQDYLEHALIAYQRGGNAANGRSNAIMGGIAKPLSKQDVQNIAAYLHSLPSSLVLRK